MLSTREALELEVEGEARLVDHMPEFAIFISVRPYYADQIITGWKTVELRRKFPEVAERTPSLIYSSSPAKAVLASAWIRRVHTGTTLEIWRKFHAVAGIERGDYMNYFRGSRNAHAIELFNVQPFETPLPLPELREKYGFEPPRSWRYLAIAEFERMCEEGGAILQSA